MNSHYLAALFEPESVAIIGATERRGAIGAVLIENMLEVPYSGKLFAVNPKHRSVRGVKSYASVGAIPQRIDLAVIATPPATVPGVVEECGRAGTRFAVIITAGFSEIGAQGAALERAVVENAKRHGMRLLGPNCLGLMRPEIGLNATFAHGNALSGSLAIVSQSGAICTAILDWARPNGLGFSSVVSLGGSADLDFGEIVDYLSFDPRTQQIVLYIEGIRSARAFLGALRAAARTKPVVVMKAGRHPGGVRAAVSHTGALVGADDVFEAAIRRTGAVRVTSIAELVAAAQALSARVQPAGDRLAIVTNGGGPGVLAADRAADLQLPLAEFAPETIASLSRALPANWSQGNPVDLIGDADAERYRAAVSACVADPNVDGVLAILTPQAMTAPADAARAVVAARKGSRKPLLAAWMGEEQVAEGQAVLRAASIPVFRTPEPAVEMFAHVASFYRNQRMLLQTPGPLAAQQPPDLEAARQVIEAAIARGVQVLSAADSKAVLSAFHIPAALAAKAATPDEAVALARRIGFPVVVKIDSPDVTHKTEVGGVRLRLGDEAAVRSAFDAVTGSTKKLRPDARIAGVTVEKMIGGPDARELMIGVLTDRVFGPAITFGAGGTAVEVLQDRAVGLPPLNAFLANEMIRSTHVSKLLGPFRGMAPADMAAIEHTLLRVSELVCEFPQVRELDVNPLLADADGVIAADARIVLGAEVPGRRYAHVAIPPYPTHLVSTWTLSDGSPVTIRPIRPEDAEIEREFVKGLSSEAKYLRFMSALRELSPAMVARFTQIDYDRELALIAVVNENGREVEIAVARYIIDPDRESCEFAIVVADRFQGRGLGRHLMMQLIDNAQAAGLRVMNGHILARNTQMLLLTERLGFTAEKSPDDPSVMRVRRILRD